MDTLNDDNDDDNDNDNNEDIHSSKCSIVSESARNDAISVIDAIKDKFRLYLAHRARC